MFTESDNIRTQDIPAIGETDLDETGSLDTYDSEGADTTPARTYQDDLDHKDDATDPALEDESESIATVGEGDDDETLTS